MQATMNSNALARLPRLQFARRSYMVRSEKRRRPNPQGSASGSGRPPRKRRGRAGIFYKILTVLLLMFLWPVGLILLWRRRLRWSALTKVFATVITLMACILLYGAALTVRVDNPAYTAAQDRANDILTAAVDGVVDFSMDLGERVQLSLDALEQLNGAYRGQSLLQMADAIDQGVALAQGVRTSIGGWFSEPAAEPESAEQTEEPSAIVETAAPEDTGAPAGASAEPTDERDAEPTDEVEATPEAAAAPTSVPAAEITVAFAGEELPVYIPESAPDPATGTAIFSGMLSRAGVLEEGALPDITPEPMADATPEPTAEPEILSFALKPAGEATVYFNIGSGQYYHMTNVCGPMKNADTHTFAEAALNIHEPCERCTPPDKSLLEASYIVWLDESDTAHLSDECEAFEGLWRIVTAEEADEAGYTGCSICAADRYLRALADGKSVMLTDAHAEDVEDADELAA